MVHISDGILSLPVLAAGWAITIALIALFFVAHLAHFFALVLQVVLFQTTKKATFKVWVTFVT